MRKRFDIWTWAGFFTAAVLGTLDHFAYDWSGKSLPVGAFCAVNESTWEHMKLLFFPVLVAAVVQVKLAGKHKRSWKQRGAHALACACGIFAVLYLGYFSPNPLKPATTYGWAWQETYYKYGYLAGSLEAASLMVAPILQQDGYSEDAATEAAAMAQDYQASPETANEQDYPDVFLILSESFYDFDLVTDLQADQEIMQVTKNLPNSIYGHTISPHVGGGTNSSEYEMLSSNSLMLMPSITPLNWLNLHKANSLVSNLKELGYATLAAHPYTNSNYRRDSAWLTLVLDETHFQDDFPTKETYGSRPYQDKFPLFWSADDFENSRTEGFLRLEDGRTRVRLGGQVADYDVSDAACGLYDPLRRLICAVYENYAYLLG